MSPTGRDFAAFAEADLAMYEGRLSDAATILTQALSVVSEGRSATTTARLTVTLAEVRQLQGANGAALKLAEHALTLSNEQTVVLLGGA